MTENEAIKNIRAYAYMEAENIPNDVAKSLDMAIQALEEIQKYRAIGTAEECLRTKDFLDFLSDKMNPNDFEVYLRIYNSQDEKGSDEE